MEALSFVSFRCVPSFFFGSSSLLLVSLLSLTVFVVVLFVRFV